MYSGVKTSNLPQTPAHLIHQYPTTRGMQAAIAAANKKPGVVFLPAGTYRLSAPLMITRSGVVLRGAGVSMLGNWLATACLCRLAAQAS